MKIVFLFSLFILAFKKGREWANNSFSPYFFIVMKKVYKDENYKKLINSGSKWKKIRDAKIKANPICEICNKELAQEVHHIQPLEDYIHDPETMKQLAYDPNNLQTLCRSCHYDIHRELKRQRYMNKEERKEKNNQRTQDFLDRFFGE